MQTALRIFSERPQLAAGTPASSPTSGPLSSPASDRPPAGSRLAKQISAGDTMADEAAEAALPMENLRVEGTQPQHAMHAPVNSPTAGAVSMPGSSKPPAGSRLAMQTSAGIKAAKEGPLSALAVKYVPADVQLQQASNPVSMAASAAQHQTEGKNGAHLSARKQEAGEEAMQHSENAAVQFGPLCRASEEDAVPDEAALAPSVKVAVEAVVQQSGSAAPSFGSQEGASKEQPVLDEEISATRMEDPDEAELPNSVNAAVQSKLPQGASEEEIVPDEATPALGMQNATKASAQHLGAGVNSVPQEMASEEQALPNDAVTAQLEAAEAAEQYCEIAAVQSGSQEVPSGVDAVPDEVTPASRMSDAAEVAAQHAVKAAGKAQSQVRTSEEQAIPNEGVPPLHMQKNAAEAVVQRPDIAAAQAGSRQGAPKEEAVQHDAVLPPNMQAAAAETALQRLENAAQMLSESTQLNTHAMELPASPKTAAKVITQPSESATQLGSYVAEPPVVSGNANKVIVQPSESSSQLDSHVAEPPVVSESATKVEVQPCESALQLGPANNGSDAGKLGTGAGAEVAEAGIDESAALPPSESAQQDSHVAELLVSTGTAAKAVVQPSKNASQLGPAVTSSNAAELGSSTGAEAAEAGIDEGTTQPPSESAQLDSDTEELPISSGTAAVAAAPHSENALKSEAVVARTHVAELGRGTGAADLAAVEHRAGAPQAQSRHLRQLFSRAAELPGGLKSAPVATAGHSEDTVQLEVAKTNSSAMQLGTTTAAVAAAGCRKDAAQIHLDSAQLESNALEPPVSPENAGDRSRKRNRPIELEKLEEAEKPARGHPAQQGDPNMFSEDALDTAILATSGAGGLQAIICSVRHPSVQQDVSNQSDQHCNIRLTPPVSLLMCRTTSAGLRVAEKQPV